VEFRCVCAWHQVRIMRALSLGLLHLPGIWLPGGLQGTAFCFLMHYLLLFVKNPHCARHGEQQSTGCYKAKSAKSLPSRSLQSYGSIDCCSCWVPDKSKVLHIGKWANDWLDGFLNVNLIFPSRLYSGPRKQVMESQNIWRQMDLQDHLAQWVRPQPALLNQKHLRWDMKC
jgi:hypothetical protein